MKGFVFTTDVFVGLCLAIIIIFAFVNLRFESSFPEKKYEKLNYFSEDLLNLVSHLKARGVSDKPTIKSLLSAGVLIDDDLNKTILDLIGSFWFSGNESIAGNISKEILEGMLNGTCINFTAENQIIYSSCNTTGESVSVRAQIASGYELGRPVYGYVARAFLTSILSKTTSYYVYFGGFEGDGNLTKLMDMPAFDSIGEISMEMDVGNNFTLYLNGNPAGPYVKGSSGGGTLRSDKWVVCNSSYMPSYCSYIHSGQNTINLYFNKSSNNYVGGGYLVVTYNSSQMISDEQNKSKYQFPGVIGFINIYSSFYVPGNLNSMFAYLHYRNNYTTYLSIGDKEVYRNDSTSLQTVSITNTTLSNLLDYTDMNQKTIPIRLGTETNITVSKGIADAILITDTSSSMNWRLDSSSTGTTRGCSDPQLYSNSTKRISLAKCLDREFIDIVLNVSGNRIGLVNYSGKPDYVRSSNVQMVRSSLNLSSDKNRLYDETNGYVPNGATGICGAIRQARMMLEQQSNASRNKYIIVMTDGLANVQCSLTDEYSTLGCIPDYCPRTSYCSGGGCLESQCGDYLSARASSDAINDSCRAHNSANVTIYAIGFGPVYNCPQANNTLMGIANCGNGAYYGSQNATEIEKIYRLIAGAIVNASYSAQEIVFTGEPVMNNTFYPDSYIEFNYTSTPIPFEYGEISLTRETERFKNFSGDTVDIPYKIGWFNASQNLKVTDLKVTSYSSEFWTDRLYIRNSTGIWSNVFWLGDYGSDYQKLGDPYIVNIPVSYLGVGNNSAGIGTGLGPGNVTGGSPDDKIIYTARVAGSVGYSDPFNTSAQAIADARQRLIDKISSYVNVDSDNINIENRYVSGIRWLWGPSLFKIIAWEK